MKKVLLIGDSIRLGYINRVKELLDGKAEVWGPEDNCRFAKYTLWYINMWIKQFGTPDIIHWNNGIWDTFHMIDGFESFVSVDEYVRDMLIICDEMKKTGATVIFATTTPVKKQLVSTNCERIEKFNAAITERLREKGVVINDLYSVISENVSDYISDDCLHLSESGVDAAAKQVVKTIEQYL